MPKSSKSLKQWFPKATRSSQSTANGNEYVIATKTDYLHIPDEALTDREKWLLNHFLDKPLLPSTLPLAWKTFLIQLTTEKTASPQALPDLDQFVQLVWLVIPYQRELAETLEQAIPDTLGIQWLTPELAVLVREFAEPSATKVILSEIKDPLTDDFGVNIDAFIGSNWEPSTFNDQIVLEERQIVSQLQQLHKPFLVDFSEIALWYFADQPNRTIKEGLQQQITAVPDYSDLIKSLWHAAGNISKASQRLFVHRNTLNYRIDRFYEQTGLQLRQLDDLALCHLLFPSL